MITVDLDEKVADFYYGDSIGQGRLTEILIQQRYLEAMDWHGNHPKYHLEVKSSRWDRQYSFKLGEYVERKHGKARRIQENIIPEEIYGIIWVFKLSQSGMGFMIFLDPEQYIHERKLVAGRFTVS